MSRSAAPRAVVRQSLFTNLPRLVLALIALAPAVVPGDLDALPSPTPLPANINFQPASSTVPAGYLADTGAVYGQRSNGYEYGWDADSSTYTRDRDNPSSPDQRYDTLNHMQLYGAFQWEVAVPNGFYMVHLVAGDPDSTDSVYKLNVENMLTVDGAPLSGFSPWVEGTQVVSVTDGRLTVSNTDGAINNKVNFIDITALSSEANIPPVTPTITEPAIDGETVNPADVHMETFPFSDFNAGDTHVCSDWQIWTVSPSEIIWTSPCNSAQPVHIHLGDGTFVNSYAGRTELVYDTNYILKTRHKDSSGDPATEWSAWRERRFHTSMAPTPGTSVAWAVRQTGYQVDVVATGFTLPVNIAFVPNAGTQPSSPYLYVTELYGNIKAVTRDGTVSDYAPAVLNYRPSGVFPGSGEQGLTGIVVEPVTGDVFASMLYEAYPGGPHYPKVVRFHSEHNGIVATSATTVLDMVGETQAESHQISNLTIGPDGKLYVHMGDGFDITTAQNLDSFRGKILRMNLDGSPATDNPFYNATDGISARDYVYAYGFRNPFGGDWRAADGFHYEVENGPSVDRFAKIVAGRNYLWDGTDDSMRNYAIYNWSPAVAPVNMAFIQPETFGGSGFPADKMGHAFVSESGPTYATGPQTNGKRISEFVLDSAGNLVSGPTPLIEYTGTGKATACGLAAGPDGLYFTELYKDLDYVAATDPGANLLRVRPTVTGGDFAISSVPTTRNVKRGRKTKYTISVTPSGGFAGSVTFSVSGLPAATTATFSPNPTSSSSTMVVTTTASTPPGKSRLTVTGTSGSLQHMTTPTLNVRQ